MSLSTGSVRDLNSLTSLWRTSSVVCEEEEEEVRAAEVENGDAFRCCEED